MQVAFKIDVDTHQGMRDGVPALAELLERAGVTASFFIAMGPDNSGKAIWRVFRNRGFLTKMRRTSAVTMYGWRTVLSGTLLPPRLIARAFPGLLQSLAASGFEVGLHGYDHVRWQDHVDRLGQAGLAAELERAQAIYRSILGDPARGFAAPGWRANAASMRVLENARLAYHSDTRGRHPYKVRVGGEVFTTPEIPTTLPTLDEVLGREDTPRDRDGLLRYYLGLFDEQRLNVHTIHAETEGMGYLEHFAALVRALKQRDANFLQLGQAAAALDRDRLPICDMIRGNLPGRAGWVATQAAGEGVPT